MRYSPGGAGNAMDGYLLDLTHPDSFQKWAVICAAGLTILYAIMRPWRKSKDPLVRPPISLSTQREVERQLTDLVVELEQMARQMTGQLDTRAAKLESLIREADAKIAMLRELGSPASRCPPAGIVCDAPDLPDPRHAEVYELADQGRSARQIAQQLERPYGEVELILALRGSQNAEVSAVG